MWLNAVCIFEHFNRGSSESAAFRGEPDPRCDAASRDAQKNGVISFSTADDIQDGCQEIKHTFGVLGKPRTRGSCRQ